jgi:hypothetical protein
MSCDVDVLDVLLSSLKGPSGGGTSFSLPLLEDGTTASVICSLLLDGALGVDLELDWPLPEGENWVNMIFGLGLLKRSP